MTTPTTPTPPPDPRRQSKVAGLVDEAGNAIEEAEERLEDASLEAATAVEETIGDAGPWVWWRLGLIVLAILVAAVLVLQYRGSDTGTSNRPAPAPQIGAPAPTPAK